MAEKTPFEKYLRQFEFYGPELLLETAARDRQLSDSEYDSLFQKLHPKPKANAKKLADRDYAGGKG